MRNSLLLVTILALGFQIASAQPPATIRFSVAQTQASQAVDPYRPIVGDVIRETPHFQIYAENRFLPVDLDWLQLEAEAAYAYVSSRMRNIAGEQFAIAFRPPDTQICPIRGIARFEPPKPSAVIFAGEQTSRIQILGVLAHEVGHLFHGDQSGSGNIYLNEGLATWAAGKYWEAWKGASLEDNVRLFQQQGRYIPLTDYFRDEVAATFGNDSGDCLADRDLLYTSWAGFLDYLVTSYGMEKLRQLLASVPEPPRPARLDPRTSDLPTITTDFFNVGEIRLIISTPKAPPLPDFRGVYGLTLDELEKAWHEKLTN